MSKKESRRRVPVSAIAIAVFVLLVVFEVLVIGGALEIKSSTVARIAPWAYEPFLRLVGEHPESDTMKESAQDRTAQGGDTPSTRNRKRAQRRMLKRTCRMKPPQMRFRQKPSRTPFRIIPNRWFRSGDQTAQ